MNSTIAMPARQRRPRAQLPIHRIALGIAIFTTVIVVGLVFDEAAAAYRLAFGEQEVAAVRSLPRKDLPPEWQWKREPVKYEHMYGSDTQAPKLDWIRNGASSQTGSKRW